MFISIYICTLHKTHISFAQFRTIFAVIPPITIATTEIAFHTQTHTQYMFPLHRTRLVPLFFRTTRCLFAFLVFLLAFSPLLFTFLRVFLN
jgi:hypothetical protein